MNKIFVSRDKIISDTDGVIIDNNRIKFLVSGDYSLEYKDIEKIDLVIEVSNDLSINLYERRDGF